MWTVIIFSNKDCSFFDLSLGRKGRNFSPTLLWVVVPNNFSFITIGWDGVFAMNITSKRLLHDIFHIGPGISPKLPYMPDSEAGWLIWVEGWCQGRYGKCHVIIYFSHILHWSFSIIDLYIAEQIFELTNCENKRRVAFVQLANKIYPKRLHFKGNSYSRRRIHLS
jgi:hypothetical protein